MSWTPSSWRNFPIKQQPTYQDQNLLKTVEEKLSSFPPIIFAAEARRLKSKLARAGRGEAFLSIQLRQPQHSDRHCHLILHRYQAHRPPQSICRPVSFSFAFQNPTWNLPPKLQ